MSAYPNRGYLIGCLLFFSVSTLWVYSSPIWITTFGTSGSGNGQFNGPRGLSFNLGNGRVYVMDTGNNRVQIFDDVGNYLSQFGSTGSGNGQFNAANDLAIDPTSSNVVVIDTGNNRAQIFDASGTFLSKFGSGGGGDGQFNVPSGVSIESNSNIVVADTNANRMQTFNSAGTFLSKFGSGGGGTGKFNHPFGVSVNTANNNIYVADTGNNRVQIFDSAGTFLNTFGSSATLSTPKALDANPGNTNTYVAEQGNNRIQFFDAAFTSFATLGGPSSGSGVNQFNGPLGIAVDQKNGKVFVGDTGNNRIVFIFEPTAWTQAGTCNLPLLPLNQALTLSSGYILSVSGATTITTPAILTLNTGSTFTTGSLAINQGTLADNSGATIPNNVAVVTSATISSGASNTLSLNGIISGVGASLTKTGTGTLVLGGADTYSGGTTISQGTIQITTAERLPDTGTVNIGASGTLLLSNVPDTIGDLTGSGVLNLSGASSILTFGTAANTGYTGTITGTGGLVKQGTGVCTISGANPINYSGSTLITGGTFQAGAVNKFSSNSAVTVNSPGILDLNNFSQTIANFAGTGTVALGTGTLTFGNGSNTAFSGILSGGSGNVITQWSGNFTLNGSYTTLSTTIEGGGSFTLGAGSSFSPGSLSINQSTLADTVNTTLGNNIALTTSGTIDSILGNTFTLNGVISGVGATLTKTGTGTLILGGVDTYSGGTTISAGTVQINTANRLPDTGTVNIGGSGTLLLSNVPDTIGDLTGSGILNLAGLNSILNFGTASSTSYTGTITGTGGLIKQNGGTFTLTPAVAGTVNYSGASTVNGGTLQAGIANAFSPNSAVTVNSPGILSLNNFSQTIANLAGTGSVTLGTGTLIFGNGSNTAFSGTLSGVSGNVIKQGSGDFTLNGTFTTASTTLQGGGTFTLGAGSSFNPGTLSINQSTLADTVNTVLGSNITLTTSGTISSSSGNTFILNGVISGSGATLIKTGTGTLVLGGANTYSGGTTISAGTVQTNTANSLPDTGTVNIGSSGTLLLSNVSDVMGDLAGSGILDLFGANALLTFGTAAGSSFTGTIMGTGGLTKENGGTFTLTPAVAGTVNYSGVTTVNGGTFQGGIANAFSPNSAVTVTSPGILDLNNFSQTIANLAGTGTVTLGTGTLTFGNGSNTAFSGTLSGVSGNVIKQGSGDFTLNGAFTTLSTTLQGGGTFTLGAGNSFNPGTLTIDQSTLADTANTTLGSNISLITSGTINSGTSNTFTLNEVISGVGASLTKTGAGILTLNGANTYSGGTAISQGTIQVDTANALPSTGTVNIESTGTLLLSNVSETIGELAGSGAVNLSGASALLTVGTAAGSSFTGSIIGAGGLTKQGAGTFTIAGTNTVNYSGSTLITDGNFQAGATDKFSPNSEVTVNSPGILDLNNFSQTIANLAGTGSVTLGTGTLTLGNGSSTAFSGILSGGSGHVIKQGSGDFMLNGAFTTLSTTLQGGGSFTLGAGSSFSPGSLSINQSTLADTVNTTLGNNIALTTSGTIDSSLGNTFTLNGVISGVGATLTKTGTGTLILGGADTYSGGTTISAGTVQINTANRLPDTGTVNIGGSGTLLLSNVPDTIGDLTGSGILNLAGINSILTFGTSSSTSYTGTITGTGGLTKQGTGIFTLSGANPTNYTGETIINVGTLQMGKIDGISTSSEVIVNGPGIWDLDNFNQSIKNFLGVGSTGSVKLGSATLTINDTADRTFSGVISQTGNIAKQGTNILTLSGANTYTGTTTINNGTLKMGVANGIMDSSEVIVNGPGIWDLNNLNQSIKNFSGTGGTGSVTLGSATLMINDTADRSFAGVISGSGNVVKQGTNILTLSGANPYTGTTTVDNGTLQMGVVNGLPNISQLIVNSPGVFDLNSFNQEVLSIAGSGDIHLGSATLAVGNTINGMFSGVISGVNGNLIKQGTNTVNLSGTNTYTGTTTIKGGTLQMGKVDSIASSSEIIVNGPGMWDLNNLNQSIKNFSGTGSVTLGSATLTINDNADRSFAGVISGRGNVVKQGTNILTLSDVNTYTGTTTVNNGTLELSTDNATAASSEMIVNVGGAISFAANTETFKKLTGNGTVNITGAGTLQIGTSNQDFTYGGNLSALTGTLVKQGTGILSMTGSSTTQTTSVQAGTLMLGAGGIGSLVTNVLNVQNGGTLRGTGTITGIVNILAGGTASAGNSVGTLNIVNGPYNQLSGSILSVDISATPDSSKISVTGMPGTIVIQPNTAAIIVDTTPNLEYMPNTVFTFMEATGGITGEFTNVPVQFRSYNVVFIPPSSLGGTAYAFQIVQPSTLAQFTTSGSPQYTVAVAFDSMNLAVTNPQLDNILDNQTPEDFLMLLDEMHPMLYDDAALSIINAVDMQMSAIGDHLFTRRKECCSSNCLTWASALFDRQKIRSFDYEQGRNIRYAGLFAGWEYFVSPNFLVGASGSYVYDRIEWTKYNSGSKGDINNFDFIPYCMWHTSNAYIEGSIGVGGSDVDIKRNVVGPFINESIESNHAAYRVFAELDFGVSTCIGDRYEIELTVDNTLTYLYEDTFKEKGSSINTLNLRVADHYTLYARNEIGVLLGTNYCFRCFQMNADLNAYVKMSVVNEGRLKKHNRKAHFQGGPYFGVSPSNDIVTLIVPAFYCDLKCGPNAFLTAHYRAEIGKHERSAEVGLKFSYNY